MLQAAEAVQEEPADVGNPKGIAEGNIEGPSPAVPPGQKRRETRKAKAGKLGGPCYKCLVRGTSTSHWKSWL